MDLSQAMWAGENWQADLDKLKELQGMSKEIKTSLQQQEEFILQTYLHPMGCPLCETKVGSKDNDITCPSCGVGLLRVVPFVKVCNPGWHWIINEESREKLLELWRKR
jgi:hypothetical protein